MLAAAMNHPDVAGAPPAESRRARRPATNWCRRAARLGPGEIVYSNGFALMALARTRRRRGASISASRRTASRTSPQRSGERANGGADILVTSGGASVGDHDLVQRALAAEGLDLSFWRVALRPGRPMMHGRLGAMQVLGVPGNPVSSYVCAFLFLVPLISAPCRPQRR